MAPGTTGAGHPSHDRLRALDSSRSLLCFRPIDASHFAGLPVKVVCQGESTALLIISQALLGHEGHGGPDQRRGILWHFAAMEGRSRGWVGGLVRQGRKAGGRSTMISRRSTAPISVEVAYLGPLGSTGLQYGPCISCFTVPLPR